MDTFPQGEIHQTAIVGSGATLGRNVTVGPFSVVHDGVQIADGVVIGSHCSIGEPVGSYYEEASDPRGCVIGRDSLIRSHSVIYDGVTAGPRLRTGHRINIREGSVLGDDVQVGTMSDLQGELTIGDHVRIHSSVFIASMSTIHDFAWLFPKVTLANDPHPPSDTCTSGPEIGEFAAIGAASLVMPGIRVGRHALVGAMSLVTRDVADEMVVVGSPATTRGAVQDVVCRHGELDQVYPWPVQFRRGYPDGALPPAESFTLGHESSPTA